jgi:hypothetical protein
MFHVTWNVRGLYVARLSKGRNCSVVGKHASLLAWRTALHRAKQVRRQIISTQVDSKWPARGRRTGCHRSELITARS